MNSILNIYFNLRCSIFYKIEKVQSLMVADPLVAYTNKTNDWQPSVLGMEITED